MKKKDRKKERSKEKEKERKIVRETETSSKQSINKSSIDIEKSPVSAIQAEIALVKIRAALT